MLKVYEINTGELWAGAGSPIEVLQAYMQATGRSHREATGDEAVYPFPLGERSVNELKITVAEDGSPLAEPISFRAYLEELAAAGVAFPCFFASVQP